MLLVPSDPFMASWERKRQPDDVPRAVRDALSTVAESDDFRIRAVTDAEPTVQPLGPFAVVDLARGTSADTAALRERSGYYALVEELLAVQDARTTGAVASIGATPEKAAPAVVARTVEPSATSPSAPTSRAPRSARKDEPTVAERIAPRRRTVQPPPEPRGRFTQVEAQPTPLATLEGPEGRTTLQKLLQQHGHRPALLRAIAHAYVGARGAAPSAPELDALLGAQGLLESTEASERQLILEAISEHRGALGRVAWALGLRGPELRALVTSLGLGEAVERARERFRREALAPASWTARLDLLGRRRYLEDLGVERQFEERLRTDLERELHALGPEAHPPIESLARRLAASPTLVTRALERLGLLSEADASTPPT